MRDFFDADGRLIEAIRKTNAPKEAWLEWAGVIWILQKILAEHKLEEVKVKQERENASFVWMKLEGKRIAISVITNKMVRMKLSEREKTSPAKFTSSIADLFDTEVEDIEGCFRLVRTASNYIPTWSFILRMLSGTIYSNID